MPAPNDLTWQQFQEAYSNVNPGIDTGCLEIKPVDPDKPNGESTLYLNISALVGSNIQSITDAGVVKTLTIMLELARNAQEALNQGKPPVDRLNALPASTTGVAANGLVPVTRSIVAKYELASATKIIG